MCNMKKLTENWKKVEKQFIKKNYKKTKNDQEDIDSYTRKLLDKNMKELEKYRGV